MHRGPWWPLAKGSENNVLVVVIAWIAAWLLKRSGRGGVITLLYWLITGLLAITLYFFRDPERETALPEDIVLAPADGEVTEIVDERETRYLNRDTIRVSVFLSLLDVHVQRNPVSGRVMLIDHQPGEKLQAFQPEASDVNEYIAMVVNHETFGPVLVKQIAGILARRCVNHETVGHFVRAGDRFGMIRFGSRVDLYLPADASMLIAVGDKVFGGVTPIATLSNEPR